MTSMTFDTHCMLKATTTKKSLFISPVYTDQILASWFLFNAP